MANTWQNGGVDHNWSTAGNWSLGHTPTSSEDVVFPAGTNWACAENANPASCKSLDMSAYDQAVSGSGLIQVYGATGATNSVKLGWSSSTWAGGIKTLGATATSRIDITFGGKTISFLTIASTNGAAITNILDAAIISGNLTRTMGVLHIDGATDNAGLTHSIGSIISSGTNTRAVYYGNATISATSTTPMTTTGSGDTTYAGTSTIKCTNSGTATWTGGGVTFATVTNNGTSNITFASADTIPTFTTSGAKNTIFYAGMTVGANISATGTITIPTMTFNTLNLTGNAKTLTITAGSNVTVLGGTQKGSAGQLYTIQSDTAGTTATLTATNYVFDMDYMVTKDIIFSPFAFIGYNGSNLGTGNLVALSTGNVNFKRIVCHWNGNVYASDTADIFMQTNGAGTFNSLSTGLNPVLGLAVAPNGDVYASVYNGSIYKQAGGSGAFVDLVQTHRNWYAMGTDNAGNIYAVVFGGDIYKRTAGAGDFNPLSQTSRNWRGIVQGKDGNMYATADDVYKQTGGVGNFVATTWGKGTTVVSAGVSSSGVLYTSSYGVDVYMLPTGGAWTALGQAYYQVIGMDVDKYGNLYVVGKSTSGGTADIFKRTELSNTMATELKHYY